MPIFAATAIRDGALPPSVVHVLEPRRPIASALRSVIGDSKLEASVRRDSFQRERVSPPTPKPRKERWEAPRVCCLFLAWKIYRPSAEPWRTSRTRARTCSRRTPRYCLRASVFARLASAFPRRRKSCALALAWCPASTSVPSTGSEGESPVDLVRLRDVKHTAVTDETELTRVSLTLSEVRDNECLLDAVELELRATVDGELTAIALWTDCGMLNDTLSGGIERKSRRQMISFLPSPLSVSSGSVVKLRVAPRVVRPLQVLTG